MYKRSLINKDNIIENVRSIPKYKICENISLGLYIEYMFAQQVGALM